jgi:multidrug transporter EmrE-like cation transporter
MSWFELTMILSCVASSLILSFRILTEKANPFIFMTGVSTLASIGFFTYCQVAGISLVLSPAAILLAFLAGLSVCLLDFSFIFMFRCGAPVSLCIPIYRVLSIMISACVGIAFFNESLSPLRGLGILTACVAVYLLNCKTKEEQHV